MSNKQTLDSLLNVWRPVPDYTKIFKQFPEIGGKKPSTFVPGARKPAKK